MTSYIPSWISVFAMTIGFAGWCAGHTNDIEWGLSFPPARDDAEMALTARHMKALGVRILRMGENWKWRESKEDRFNWEPLDRRMQWARTHRFDIWLTIQTEAPDWAAGRPRNDRSSVFHDPGDFEEYVVALLKRYPNSIRWVQFGNEWEWREWYAGTADDYAQCNNILYDAAQRHSPHTTVVLGGLSTPALRRLAAFDFMLDSIEEQGRTYRGSALRRWAEHHERRRWRERILTVLRNARYDALDAHLYDDPEQWSIYIDTLRRLCPDHPVLVSEFGGPHPRLEPADDAYQADRLTDYMQTLVDCRIPCALFFTLIPQPTAEYLHRNSSLLDIDGNAKPAYTVFQTFTTSDTP